MYPLGKKANSFLSQWPYSGTDLQFLSQAPAELQDHVYRASASHGVPVYLPVCAAVPSDAA